MPVTEVSAEILAGYKSTFPTTYCVIKRTIFSKTSSDQISVSPFSSSIFQ